MSTSDLLNELDGMPYSGGVGTLTFNCKEFRMIRFLLRLLSLWRPRTAGMIERFVYPAMINLLLLAAGPVRNIIQATGKTTWLSLQSVYLVHEIGIWLGHILGNVYFRSRDLETNVLPSVQELTDSRKPLKRGLKYLKAGMVLSLLLFSVMLGSLSIASHFTRSYRSKRFTANLPNVNGTLDHILYAGVIISILYDLGIGLALAWTMGLLYICFASRLKALQRIYLEWQKPAADAIYLFRREYSRVVKRSWKRISWWFLAHNIIVVAVPLYGYELAQAIGGVAYHSKHLPHFVCYLLFVLTIWLAPIVIAEQIKRREERFNEKINGFCPGLLDEITEGCQGQTERGRVRSHPLDEPALVSGNSRPGVDTQSTINHHNYSLTYRGKEQRDFHYFLRNREPGLVSHGYTWQLNISLISIVLGMVSFLFSLHREDGVMLTDVNQHWNNTFL